MEKELTKEERERIMADRITGIVANANGVSSANVEHLLTQGWKAHTSAISIEGQRYGDTHAVVFSHKEAKLSIAFVYATGYNWGTYTKTVLEDVSWYVQKKPRGRYSRAHNFKKKKRTAEEAIAEADEILKDSRKDTRDRDLSNIRYRVQREVNDRNRDKAKKANEALALLFPGLHFGIGVSNGGTDKAETLTSDVYVYADMPRTTTTFRYSHTELFNLRPAFGAYATDISRSTLDAKGREKLVYALGKIEEIWAAALQQEAELEYENAHLVGEAAVKAEEAK